MYNIIIIIIQNLYILWFCSTFGRLIQNNCNREGGIYTCRICLLSPAAFCHKRYRI